MDGVLVGVELELLGILVKRRIRTCKDVFEREKTHSGHLCGFKKPVFGRNVYDIQFSHICHVVVFSYRDKHMAYIASDVLS